MDKRDLSNLPPWELLLKRVIWTQLGEIRGKRILDFGSAMGVTAYHYAAHNDAAVQRLVLEDLATRDTRMLSDLSCRSGLAFT